MTRSGIRFRKAKTARKPDGGLRNTQLAWCAAKRRQNGLSDRRSLCVAMREVSIESDRHRGGDGPRREPELLE
jgi:hypothetical protein